MEYMSPSTNKRYEVTVRIDRKNLPSVFTSTKFKPKPHDAQGHFIEPAATPLGDIFEDGFHKFNLSSNIKKI